MEEEFEMNKGQVVVAMRTLRHRIITFSEPDHEHVHDVTFNRVRGRRPYAALAKSIESPAIDSIKPTSRVVNALSVKTWKLTFVDFLLLVFDRLRWRMGSNHLAVHGNSGFGRLAIIAEPP